MKGFLKELQESNATGAFETVRTGEVALTPNKWHTMAAIDGNGKLLQADLFGCIPYNSSGANIGEGAAHHHFMVTTPRTIGVKVFPLNTPTL